MLSIVVPSIPAIQYQTSLNTSFSLNEYQDLHPKQLLQKFFHLSAENYWQQRTFQELLFSTINSGYWLKEDTQWTDQFIVGKALGKNKSLPFILVLNVPAVLCWALASVGCSTCIDFLYSITPRQPWEIFGEPRQTCDSVSNHRCFVIRGVQILKTACIYQSDISAFFPALHVSCTLTRTLLAC